MHWSELVRALALVMVIEGLLPFVSPARWRQAMATVAQMGDGALRTIGLVSVTIGLFVLQVTR